MKITSVRLENPEKIELFQQVLKEKKSEILRDLLEKGKKTKAVELYKNKKVSLGLGAELAGLSLSEFLELLAANNVKFNYTLQDAKISMENANKLL